MKQKTHFQQERQAREDTQNTAKKLIGLEQDKSDKQEIVLEGILPLAIEAENLMEIINIKRT